MQTFFKGTFKTLGLAMVLAVCYTYGLTQGYGTGVQYGQLNEETLLRDRIRISCESNDPFIIDRPLKGYAKKAYVCTPMDELHFKRQDRVQYKNIKKYLI